MTLMTEKNAKCSAGLSNAYNGTVGKMYKVEATDDGFVVAIYQDDVFVAFME